MKWVSKSLIKTNWHSWFAWHPVTIPPTWIDGNYRCERKVWLETVERKGTWKTVGWDVCLDYEYRTKE